MWKLQALDNRRWKTLLESSELEVRAAWNKSLMRRGTRRMLDESNRQIARVKIDYAEIEVSHE